jgi:hypothetical protein
MDGGQNIVQLHRASRAFSEFAVSITFCPVPDRGNKKGGPKSA